MATEATIRRWDHVLDEVEKTRKGSPFINLLVPGYKRFDQGFRLTVAAITKAFRDASQTDRPANKNVTTPEGAAAAGADTSAESHNRYARSSQIARIRLGTVANAEPL
ncbi:MAG TPA: hypothetical protein VE197_05080 [Mycobacterium sp.]|nr:hypothetical protein [Mycobacterium sp.]